ncbi:cytochrome P450 [Suillus clintonianus]|uniref:cytochrome P450 n=1 Tax=Suillus clintonianus TaxID=1904413 RepID=UPI001B85C805|nr:cytochrome P450 [Suillus clintonianus]KAG2147517.1 cytochrome P450 [Suillus clintonianus]
MMIPLQSFFLLILQKPLDLHISDNTQLLLSATACLGIIGVIFQAYRLKSERNLPLPPSPPTWRLGGHLLPPRKPFLTVAEWIDEYGPLITIRSKFQNIVIIGRYKAAVDIMETQGKILADRPPMISGEIFTGGMSIALAPWGDRFRRMRRALHSHLQPKAAEAYQPLLMLHGKNIVLGILDDPHNLQNHVVAYAATTIMKIAYGKNKPTSATDPEVVEMHQIVEMSAVLRPGAHMVDLIPWLKYLPWYGRDLKLGFKKLKQLNIGQLNRVKEQMQNNEDTGPSFTKYMLENSHLYGLTETEMAFLAGAFFGGGTQTTSLAICTVLMAAACFPEEQAKVHAELDAVIGRHRAPTFADQGSLPRLQAFISETLRWRPGVSSSLSHRTTQDVIWENYCIPAGTTVLGHLWPISRDPDVYPEPDAFKPQRWLDDQGSLRDDIKFFVYGFGRRVCPGQYVADRSVFISALLILWAFRLTRDPTKPLDDMGFMNGSMPSDPLCAFEFETRIPEMELRCMMQQHPEKL